MNRIEKVQYAIAETEAKVMLKAINVTGKLMTTKAGKAMLAVPIAVSVCSVVASADDVNAQGMIDGIMKVLKPGVVGLGSLIAVVGGIQTGVGFKDDNADGKTRGFQTLIGGAIVAAVGGIVPDTIKI
ncbi:MAG: hypothetical protein MSH60_04210 [Ruminococcus sp.]|nr:hypothetical protein [Ruminococcus sp.]